MRYRANNLLNKTMFLLCIVFVLAGSYVMADSVQVNINPTMHFQTDDIVTVGGLALDSSGSPLANRNISVVIRNPAGSSTTVNAQGTLLTDAEGKFTSDNFTGTSTSGQYTAIVQLLSNAIPPMPPTMGFAFFFVEGEREYQVYTDQYIYDIGDNVTITIEVYDIDANGTKTPADGAEVPLIVFREDGTPVIDQPGLTTTNGTATVIYTVPDEAAAYGEYLVDVKNGKSMAMFKVPYFNVDVILLNDKNVKTNKFSTANNVSVKVIITKESSGGNVVPVSGVQISAQLKSNNEDTSGTTQHTFSASDFTESDGVYTSTPYKLNSVQSGNYYVEVTATKTQSVTQKKFMIINSLDLELEPIFANKDITAFLKNDNVTVGINVVDLATGDSYVSSQITDADIISCKKDGKDCLADLPTTGTMADSTIEGFTKFLNFVTPNTGGTYELKIRVNTTTSYITGTVYITVQSVFSTASVKDRFENMKWKVRSGESLTFDTEAWLSSNFETSVDRVTVEGCVDGDGNDVTDDMLSGGDATNNGSSVNMSAPSDGGCYVCTMKVETANGTSYTQEQVCVQKYDIWVETKKKTGANWDWAWRFASDSNAYFHVNVMNDAWQQVAASKLTVELTGLTNIITGTTYSVSEEGMNVTSTGHAVVNATTGSKGKPVINLSLEPLSLTSGFYEAEVEVTDDEGSVDTGTAFFQVSNLDVFVDTQRSGSSAFVFKPTDTVQLSVTANFFNGTPVPNGSNVTVDKLLFISGKSPKVISTDKYTATTNTTAGGQTVVTVKPKSGQSLKKGDYLVFVKVDTGSVEEIREAWFMVKSFFVYAYTMPFYYAQPSVPTTIYGFVFDPDFNLIPNINISFEGFYDTQNFDLVEQIGASPTTTNAWGSFELNVNSTPAIEDVYVYVIDAFNPNTGEAEEYIDYLQIQKFSSLSCSFVDSDQSTVSPSSSVQYKITITNTDGTGVADQNVSITKFTDLESWTDKVATTTSSGTTNADGVATITVTAPSSIGRYRPIPSVNGEELSSDSYSAGMWPCELGVYQTEVEVQLQDSNGAQTTQFVPESNISVNFLLSNPGGGAVDMNELKLVQYTCLSPQCKVASPPPWVSELGAKKTSDFDTTNILRFTAPSKKGKYMLVTQAKDTDNNIKSIPVTFEIVGATFDYDVWLRTYGIDLGQTLVFGVNTGGDIKINVTGLTNIDTGQAVNIAGTEQSFSEGQEQNYTYDLSGLTQSGTFDVELCIYTGATCTNTSDQRVYTFNVYNNVFPWGRPFNPMGGYASGDTISLEVKLENNVGGAIAVADGDVYLQHIWNGPTDLASEFTVAVGDSPNAGWKLVNLTGFALDPGGYEAEVAIEYLGVNYTAMIHFYVKQYDLDLITSDGSSMDSPDFQPPRYSTGDNVDFNISGPADTDGKLYIFDADGWVRLDGLTADFTTDGTGFHQETMVFADGGPYVAIAAIPDLDSPMHVEAHYPFDIKSGFDVFFNWENMHTFIGNGENLTLEFTVYDVDGNPLNGGEINVTILQYFNPMNWNVLNDSVGITANDLVIGGDGVVSFSFNPQVALGEYEAEVAFNIGSNQVIRHVWFRISAGDFWAWPDRPDYKPGDTVNLFVNARNPDGSGISGQTMELEYVEWGNQTIDVSYLTTTTDTTDANGEAQLAFTIPPHLKGSFRAILNWTDQNEIRTVTVSSSSLWVDIYEITPWPYAAGDTLSLEVYVKEDDGTPVSGMSVNYTVRSESDNWNDIANGSAGDTDADGKATINYDLPADANGFYDLEIDIGNGAVTRWWGVMVSPFDVWMNVWGEVTGEDATYGDWELPTTANVVVSVDVNYQNGSAIAGANVTLIDVWQIGHNGPGTSVMSDITGITTDTSTDANGLAELRFGIANLTAGKDYDMEVQIQNGASTTMMRRWFRITATSWAVELTADPTLNDTSNYDVDSKGPGDLVFVSINVTGYDNKSELCLDRVQSLRDWRTHWIGQCLDYDALEAVSGAFTLNFSAPMDSGEYEAIVELRKQGDWGGWYPEKEKWLWFEVLGGAEADYQFDAWTENWNLWTGQNATVNVEIWNRQSWFNENETAICGNIEIAEIRDSETWDVVKTSGDLTQWLEYPTDPWGPPMTMLKWVVPSDLEAKEYMAKVWCEDLNIFRDTWFNIASFQPAMLMPENIMANQNVSFWLKVTYYNGSPLFNASVEWIELRNIWAGHMVERTFNLTGYTDANGEYIGEFQAPGHPSEYELVLEVSDGVDTQKIQRWFRIKGLNVDVDIDGQKKVLYQGDDATITVIASDALTGSPIDNARVELELRRHWFEGGAAQEEEEVNCSEKNTTVQCMPEEGCWWEEPNCLFLDSQCANYDGNEPECMNQEGWCWYDYGMDECHAVKTGGGFGGGGGGIREEKHTNYNGVATFDFSGENALKKGEYEVMVNVDAHEKGWFWTHKNFIVRKFNLTLNTGQLGFFPGDEIPVTITAFYTNGSPVGNEYAVSASLEESKFANMEEEMACMSKWSQDACNSTPGCSWEDHMMDGPEQGSPDCEPGGFCETDCSGCPGGSPCAVDCDTRCNECGGPEGTPDNTAPPSGGGGGSGGMCFLTDVMLDELPDVVAFDNGTVEFNLTIPLNASPGPVMLITDILDPNNCWFDEEHNGTECKMIEFLDGMILIYENGSSAFLTTVDNPIVQANEFVSININTSPANAAAYAIAPFAQHMRQSNGVVSMQEMMGGGPESGKEDFYGGETYLNPNIGGLTHFMVLARNRPGEYLTMVPIQDKGSGFMFNANFENMLALEYEVNSSAGECMRNTDCNDDDNSTWDVCVLMECVHNNVSAVSCTSDFECSNNASMGLYGICNWQGNCENVTGNCAEDSDCDDSNANTYDFCEHYECRSENATALECTQAANCLDTPPDHTAFCEAGRCVYLPDDHIGCSSDSDCAQGEWCDQMDHQCHSDMGGNCDCQTSANCTATPFGEDTIAECWCNCEYYDSSNIAWLYNWNKSSDAFGNWSAGVNWGWDGNEGADEAKPFGGSPGGDITTAYVANDSSYIYVQMETGGFEWHGGIPYCGGSYPSTDRGQINGQRYVVFYDTVPGGTCDATGADYKYEVRFRQSASYVNGTLYGCSAGVWQVVNASPSQANYSVVCDFGTIDFKVDKSLMAFNDPEQILLGVYMTNWTAYYSSWTMDWCDQNGCNPVNYYAANLSSTVDLVPNSGWQYTNDTGGWVPVMGGPGPGHEDVCGDSAITGGEECDDGDSPPESGDGCDSVCHEESGWTCTGEPSVCTEDAPSGGSGQNISVIKTKVMPNGMPWVNETIKFEINITNTGNTTFVGVPLEDTFNTSCLNYSWASPAPDTVDLANELLQWTDLTTNFGVNLTSGQSFIVLVNITANCSANNVTNMAWVDDPENATDYTGLWAEDTTMFDILTCGNANWTCDQWSMCLNGNQTCVGGWTDSNSCGGSYVGQNWMACAAPPTIEMNETYGGPWIDRGQALKQTPDGGYILAGESTSFPGTDYNFWLVKTDAAGNILWNSSIGGAANDRDAFGVTNTSDGGYAIVGYTESYGVDPPDELWIVKTNGSGIVLWNQSYGKLFPDAGYDIQETPDGGLIVAGYLRVDSTNVNDFWLLKTDENGTPLWNQTYGGTNNDIARALDQTSDGGFIMVGSTNSYGAGNDDIWLIKANSTGGHEWNYTFGGSNNDWGYDVQETSDNGFIISGYTTSYAAYGGSDFWLIKTDENGTHLWNVSIGTAGNEFGSYGIGQTSSGGFVLVGFSDSVLGAGSEDLLIVQTNSTGEVEWGLLWGYVPTENGYDVIVAEDNSVVIVGNTDSLGAGNEDFWLVKFSNGSAPSVPDVCGDGSPTGSEVCDDSNTVTETCGDGTIHSGSYCNNDCTAVLNLNEECDDSNTDNGDGCDSVCLNEAPQGPPVSTSGFLLNPQFRNFTISDETEFNATRSGIGLHQWMNNASLINLYCYTTDTTGSCDPVVDQPNVLHLMGSNDEELLGVIEQGVKLRSDCTYYNLTFEGRAGVDNTILVHVHNTTMGTLFNETATILNATGAAYGVYTFNMTQFNNYPGQTMMIEIWNTLDSNVWSHIRNLSLNAVCGQPAVTSAAWNLDVPLGTQLRDPGMFGSIVNNQDISEMIETVMNININGVNNDYNFSEDLVLNPGIAVETGLTFLPSDAWQERVFIPITVADLYYNPHFDDGLQNGNYISNTSPTEFILLPFLGKTLKIVGAPSDDSVTVELDNGSTKTYSHNDAFMGEDVTNPIWTWVLSGLDTQYMTLGTRWFLDVDDPDETENPAIQHPLYVGEEACTPGNYLCIKFDGLSSTDIITYDFEMSTQDLYALPGNPSPDVSSAKVLRFESVSNGNVGLIVGGKTTDEAYLYSDGSSLDIYYRDVGTSKAVFHRSLTTNADAVFFIDTGVTSIPIDIHWDTTNDNGTFIIVDSDQDIFLYFEEDPSNPGEFNYFGHSTSRTSITDDVLYGTRDISAWNQSTRTKDGHAIWTPWNWADTDRVRLNISVPVVNSYTLYTVDTVVESLYANGLDGSPLHAGESSLRISSNTTNTGISINGTITDKVYLYSSNFSIDVFYWDSVNNKAVFVTSLPTGGSNLFFLDPANMNLGVDVAWDPANDNGNISLPGGFETLDIYFEANTTWPARTRIDYFGHSPADTTTTNDIIYDTVDVSDWENDLPLDNGVILLDPLADQAADQCQLRVPADPTNFWADVSLYMNSTGGVW